VLKTIILSFCLLIGPAYAAAPASTRLQDSSATYTPKSVRVWFSPSGGCTAAIVEAIDSAKKSIRVQAYSFTSAPIAAALVEAHKRDINVVVVLDKSQKTEKYSSADFLAHAGIGTFIDSKHAIAHNKIIIIDESIVITGSFNFTKSAEQKNAENILIIDDTELASRYLDNWADHQLHSSAYLRK
jgi:phosphatidylserine/phosphatidylglycerophosphate/cardiolipin synthase-like enzyme